MSMKISIAVSLLILVGGAIIGRHDKQQLAVLQVTQKNLSVEASILGVSSDRSALTSQHRPTRAVIAKLSIAEVLEIAKENQRLTPNPLNYDAIGALNLRILDALSAWDVSELKAFLEEIRNTPDLNPQTLDLLISSCSTVLANDHPQAALGIFISSPEFFGEHGQMTLVCSALASWARNDHTAAIEWLKKNPQPFSDYAVTGIIAAVAEQDPEHAFRLISQLELKDSHGTVWQIVNCAKTFEQKSAALAGLREYFTTTQTGDTLDHYGESYLRQLTSGMDREGIDAITRWISEVKLTPQEMEPVLNALVNAINKEPGKWIEWMRQSLQSKQADERIDNLINHWATSDYEAAAQWATSQPSGKDRENVLKKILTYWPEHDPTGKEAFAKKYQLK